MLKSTKHPEFKPNPQPEPTFEEQIKKPSYEELEKQLEAARMDLEEVGFAMRARDAEIDFLRRTVEAMQFSHQRFMKSASEKVTP